MTTTYMPENRRSRLEWTIVAPERQSRASTKTRHTPVRGPLVRTADIV